MKLSSRARYGVRLMLELALNYGKGFKFLREIAEVEDISMKYLSQIVIPLRSAGLVISGLGAHGGYALAKDPNKITIRDIVESIEGKVMISRCLENETSCDRISLCVTRDIWNMVSERISESLDEVTLEDLVARHIEKQEQVFVYHI